MALADDQLNPAQQAVIDMLGAAGSTWPTFPAGLRDELRDELEDGLTPAVERLPDGEDL